MDVASIPESHGESAMGAWDRWTAGKRGEIPGEDGMRAARGRGQEFLRSNKPKPVCVGLVDPSGNPDLAWVLFG
jgi:hypothetical protein